ncbi:MAG: alpha/beta fold hydrolase [Myxococcota bacterium]|nr:alpha/beta fold hydrolase [Myxococcota bacterium]
MKYQTIVCFLIGVVANAIGCVHMTCPSASYPPPPTIDGTVAPDPSPAPNNEQNAVASLDEMVIFDNTPPIPDALRKKVAPYLNSRSAGFSDFSADGKQMLITTRFGQTYQTHLLKSPMGARNQLTFLDETVSGPEFVPGKTDRLTFISDTGGDEVYRVFALDTGTGAVTPVTRAGARVSAYLWRSDGERLAYNSNARNGKDMDIYVSDGRDPGTAKLVAKANGHWHPTAWSPDGKQLLIIEYISIAHSRLHLLDVASGAVTSVAPTDQQVAYRGAVFGRTNSELYVISDRDGEYAALFHVDLSANNWRSLTSDIQWNVEHIAINNTRKKIAFSVNEQGFSRIYLLNTRTKKYAPAAAVPKGRISGLAFADAADVIGFTVSTATSSSDAYAYDIRKRNVTRWTESEMGGLNPDQLVSPELIAYETFDKRKIPAFYYRPEGGKGPFPVVVQIHGGPEAQARPRFSPYLAYLTNELGVAVLVPNVRGSDGYGKTYLSLDNGMKREDSVRDIGALLDWIDQRPELDGSRVGVYGGSYGGYMVLAALAHYGDRIAAGVEIVGISNFVTFLENTKPYRRDLRRAEYGDERDPQMRKHLMDISPTTNADKLRSALFVAHGANDPRVPVGEAEQIVEAVRTQGKDVWYMLAKNEGHGFRRRENRDNFYLLMLLFFEKHLLNSN